jgi:endonuclease III related protein
MNDGRTTQRAPILNSLFRALRSRFGPQRWWPGETAFEVMVGAILAQNTNWGNVERAITNLKAAGLLETRWLAACPEERLAELIRPSGTFRVKAKRLRAFVLWLRNATMDDRRWTIDQPVTRGSVLHRPSSMVHRPAVSFAALRRTRTEPLRRELLSVHGIGPETADSILLYAFRRKKFVVDAYTRWFLARHGLIAPSATYADIQSLFERNLPPSLRLYNEYHALIVRLGKEFCRTEPRCGLCPLEPLLGPAVHNVLPPRHQDTKTERH